jgi:glutamate racemase
MEPRIGIFDSGLGGLTVFHEVAKSLQDWTLLYVGDTARVPYGTKSKETVTQYALEISRFLVAQQVQALVVACNTASAYALPALSETFEIPIIGVVEPGAQRALALTQNYKIGVIGTEGTVRSEAYPQALRALHPECEVLSQACPLFVPLVEEGWFEDPETEGIARRYLAPLQEAGVDTVILGCTHYPLLKGIIQRVMGLTIHLVDSAEEVARSLSEQLKGHALAQTATPPEHRFFVTDAPERFQRVGRQFLGGESLQKVEKITL